MKQSILNLLKSSEKWFLGDGGKLCFTPEFPEYRDTLGFFDKGSFINYTIDHIFTLDLIENDRPLGITLRSRVWYPHKIECTYNGGNLVVTENKSVVNGCFSSEICIENESENTRTITVAAWCPNINSSETGKSVYDFELKNNTLFYSMDTGDEYGMPGRKVEVAFSCSETMEGYSINLSQGRMVKSIWEMTPFYDKLINGALENELKLQGLDLNGIVYSAIVFNLELPAKTSKQFKVVKAIDDNKDSVLNTIQNNIKLCLHKESQRQWEEYFNKLPQFYCSDEYINKYYWYRWYGIRLNTISTTSGNYNHSFITEGIGFFRSLITYSATCMTMEARWMNDKDLAEGIFYNVVENQQDNGFLPGIIRENHIVGEIMYHTFWGKAVLYTYYKYGDKKFLERMYKPLGRYAAYFENSRDKEGSFLFDINNQIETGQEYSPRYLFADERADLDIDIKLKGVDSSTYMYDLYQSLRQIAAELGYSADVPIWEDKALKVKDSILSHLWNESDDMFYDTCIKERDGKLLYNLSPVKTLTGFYPFMTDMVDKKHIDAIYKHILNEKEFWSTYPLTTISMDDPYFSSDAEWKGKRHVCPWNGRVWPITNCHMIEVLAKQSANYPGLREKLVELIRKTIMIMYSFGDINMPNCYEHYNPVNGRESFYRGVNDYMHSWIVDTILKHAAGVVINENGVTIDPLDFGMGFFELDNLCLKNHRISVIWDRDNGDEAFKIMVDGKTVHSSSKFKAVSLTKYI